MKRYELINWFIREMSYRRYLEIGIDNPANCFNRVQCEHKVGVDPNKKTTYNMTSDDFFKQNTEIFDLVFIDGLHECSQVLKDVDNALRVLSDRGTIIVHDCMPDSQASALPDRPADCPRWFGDVWRAWAYLRATRPYLFMYTYAADCGCGIIRRGQQDLYTGPWQTWQDYVDNREDILRPIGDDYLVLRYGVQRD